MPRLTIDTRWLSDFRDIGAATVFAIVTAALEAIAEGEESAGDFYVAIPPSANRPGLAFHLKLDEVEGSEGWQLQAEEMAGFA